MLSTCHMNQNRIFISWNSISRNIFIFQERQTWKVARGIEVCEWTLFEVPKHFAPQPKWQRRNTLRESSRFRTVSPVSKFGWYTLPGNIETHSTHKQTKNLTTSNKRSEFVKELLISIFSWNFFLCQYAFFLTPLNYCLKSCESSNSCGVGIWVTLQSCTQFMLFLLCVDYFLGHLFHKNYVLNWNCYRIYKTFLKL